jgi:hypothetical protein
MFEKTHLEFSHKRGMNECTLMLCINSAGEIDSKEITYNSQEFFKINKINHIDLLTKVKTEIERLLTLEKEGIHEQ